jgi:hypothetical protein
MPAENRRAAQQFYKPLPKPATPLHQLAGTNTETAKSAYRAYTSHRLGCTACSGRENCTDGERLAARYVTLLNRDQVRVLIRDIVGEKAARDLQRPARRPRDRKAEWAKALPAATAAEAKRAAGIKNAVTLDAPNVPLQTLQPTTN